LLPAVVRGRGGKKKREKKGKKGETRGIGGFPFFNSVLDFLPRSATERERKEKR